ncbi:hypothetical protein K9L97_03740 [Candidatus Woesearchaeota archaeon]|nr:hypothetical protein [Candidatus Woesearchaeota archaeon]
MNTLKKTINTIATIILSTILSCTNNYKDLNGTYEYQGKKIIYESKYDAVFNGQIIERLTIIYQGNTYELRELNKNNASIEAIIINGKKIEEDNILEKGTELFKKYKTMMPQLKKTLDKNKTKKYDDINLAITKMYEL